MINDLYDRQRLDTVFTRQGEYIALIYRPPMDQTEFCLCLHMESPIVFRYFTTFEEAEAAGQILGVRFTIYRCEKERIKT
jgi:hypothetical protein